MRQRKRTIMFVFILSVCLFSNYTLLAQEYAVEDGKAFFKAKMPLNSYTGESNELKGKVNFETG